MKNHNSPILTFKDGTKSEQQDYICFTPRGRLNEAYPCPKNGGGLGFWQQIEPYSGISLLVIE